MALLLRKTRGRSLPADPGRAKNDNDASTGAKSAEPAVGRLVNDALQFMANSLKPEVARTNDPQKIAASLPWAEFSHRFYEANAPIELVIRKSAVKELTTLGHAPMEKAAGDTATAVQSGTVAPGLSVATSMNLIQPLSVQYAERQSASLVIEISSKMRATINMLTMKAAAGQISSYDMADMLKAVIPLHTAWADAVTKSFERNYVAYLKDGQSAVEARRMSQNLANAYANKLQTARAWNIARTETMSSANMGKLAGWKQGIGDGWIDPGAYKIWEEGRDPCDQCAPLVGEIQPIDQPFSDGNDMPPEHPSCRCTAALANKNEVNDSKFADQTAAMAAATAVPSAS